MNYSDYSYSERKISQTEESSLSDKSKPHKKHEEISKEAIKHIVEGEEGAKEKHKLQRRASTTFGGQFEGRSKEICDKIDSINESLQPFRLKLREESEALLSREMEAHHLSNFLPKRPVAAKKENYAKIEKKIEKKLETFNKLVTDFKKVRMDLISPERLQKFQKVSESCSQNFLPVLTSLDLIRNEDLHNLILKKAEKIKSNEESSGAYINANREKLDLTKIEKIIDEINTKNDEINEKIEQSFSSRDEELINQIIQKEMSPEKLMKSLTKEFNGNKEIYSKLKTSENCEMYVNLRRDIITVKADLEKIKQLKSNIIKMKEGSSIHTIENKELFKKLGVSDDASLDQLKDRIKQAEGSLKKELTDSNSILSNFFERNLEARDDKLIYDKLNKQESVAFENELKIIELRNELPVIVINDYIEQNQRLTFPKEIDTKMFQFNMLSISKSSKMNPTLFVYTPPSEVPLMALENVLKRAA